MNFFTISSFAADTTYSARTWGLHETFKFLYRLILMRNCQQVSFAETFKRPVFANVSHKTSKLIIFWRTLSVLLRLIKKTEKIFWNTTFDYSQLTKLFSCCAISLGSIRNIKGYNNKQNMVCRERDLVWKYFVSAFWGIYSIFNHFGAYGHIKFFFLLWSCNNVVLDAEIQS